MHFQQFYPTPLGILKITEEDGFITEISIEKNNITVNEQKSSPLLEKACVQLGEYFAGKRKSFDLPIKMHGTIFQKQVWQELLKIPYGETRSYQDIAVAVGNPKAVRAVGQANNKNRIIILIPCHRIINKSGALGGFSCGTNIKTFLLNLEKSNIDNKYK